MNRIKRFIVVGQRLLCAAVLTVCFLALLPAPGASAQVPQTVTAEGGFLDPSGHAVPFTMTFRPAGGIVTGRVDYHFARTAGEFNCDGTVALDLDGMFAGGDHGLASGSADGTLTFSCDDGSFSRARYQATWNGAFHANGTAGGTWQWSTVTDGEDAPTAGRTLWIISFSPAVFETAAQPTITEAYLYSAYGVRVVDSVSGGIEGAASWEPGELGLLNDVLKRLPRRILEQVADVTLIRGHSSPGDANGENASRLATYLGCDLALSPQCKEPSASIRVFDKAHSPFDFSNDPNGDTQFKATILHELAHALQDQRQVTASTARTPRAETALPVSSLLEDWIAATRTVTATSDPNYWSDQNGWQLVPETWIYFEAPRNHLPTEYAAADPAEDLAESVMLYVFDPARLLSRSIKRYEFLCDRVFGGVEYLPSVPQVLATTLPTDSSPTPSNPHTRR